VRDRARSRGIPVLVGGSDRGKLDVGEILRTWPQHPVVAATAEEAPEKTVGGANKISELLVFLTENAILAPSGSNAQPWHFYARAESLWVVHDRARSDNLIDVDKRGAHVALGAALENIHLAALSQGYSANIDYFPATNFLLPENHEVVALVRPVATTAARENTSKVDQLIVKQIPNRQTDRNIYGRSSLNKDAHRQLRHIVETAGCTLTLLEDAAPLAELGTLVVEADRLRMLFDDTHREMMDEIRWSPHAILASLDGVDVATLDLPLSELTALQNVKHPDVVKFVPNRGGADVLTQLSHNAVMESSAVGLISVTGHTKQAQLQGGQAIQRLWLLATALGLALHPISALIYMFNASLSPRLNAQERSELCELCDRFDLLFPKEVQDSQLMLFRLSNGQSQRKRSLRRPLNEVLSLLPNTNSPLAKEL
jgi:nitroreductase